MIERLRNLRDRSSSSENRIARTCGSLISRFGTIKRLLCNARFRSEHLTRLRQPDKHLQGSTYTKENRYPALFEQCRISLAAISNPKLLSFGCSTGEEVRSIARVMPNAVVIGADLNTWCIRQAQKTNHNERCTFIHRDSTEFNALSNLDAIFCLAVFQRTEHRLESNSGVASGFSFDKFESEVGTLDRKLRPGGLLFIDQCDFRFADTGIAEHYTPLACEANQRLRKRRLLGRGNAVIAEEYVADRIFVKRADIGTAIDPDRSAAAQ